MFRNSVFTSPVSWSGSVVGTPFRFLATCVVCICTGTLSVVGVRLLVRVVELRIEFGAAVLPLERGLFVFVCTLIILQSVIVPIMILAALRSLFYQLGHHQH